MFAFQLKRFPVKLGPYYPPNWAKMGFLAIMSFLVHPVWWDKPNFTWFSPFYDFSVHFGFSQFISCSIRFILLHFCFLTRPRSRRFLYIQLSQSARPSQEVMILLIICFLRFLLWRWPLTRTQNWWRRIFVKKDSDPKLCQLCPKWGFWLFSRLTIIGFLRF